MISVFIGEYLVTGVKIAIMELKRQIKKWIAIILLWIVVLIVSLCIFPNNITIGIWFLITGLVMHLKKDQYKKWYDKTYNDSGT